MITLTVISLNGVPPGVATSASFDELGGTIGRADSNQLVLPDPDRAISRVHAQVVYRAGAYALVDRGSNPVLVNGQPVGSGREVPIGDGDRVQIGGFVLQVRRQAATPARADGATASGAAVDDPFADLLGPAAAVRAPAGPAGGAGLLDPLAAFAAQPTAAPSAASSASAANPAPAGAAARGIPEDWDPFAPDAAPARPPTRDFAQSLGRLGGAGQFGLDGGAAAPAPLVPDLPSGGTAGADSLDALFGLRPGNGGDPLADSPLDAPMSAPNMAASHDPLKSLRSAPLASAQTAQDAVSDLHRPYAPPPAFDRAAPGVLTGVPKVAAAFGAPDGPGARGISETPPAASGIAAGVVLSWDTPEGAGRTVIRPTARAAVPSFDATPAAAVAPASAPEPGSIPDFGAATNPPAAAPAYANAAAATTAPEGQGADVAALLAAFRDGLDMPSLKLDALTPPLMRLVGELLHESARGTVDLLVARAALKREVRAEATLIVAQKNNPLKFSPNAEVALQHLLSPTMRGFMEPAPALRDAYDDLRAHQFGFVAGMRAALTGVLERFRPEALERRLTQPTGLRALLPGSRKAAMWEVFTEHYAQIGTEAEEDFHSLFGAAFLKAYEEHIARLKETDR